QAAADGAAGRGRRLVTGEVLFEYGRVGALRRRWLGAIVLVVNGYRQRLQEGIGQVAGRLPGALLDLFLALDLDLLARVLVRAGRGELRLEAGQRRDAGARIGEPGTAMAVPQFVASQVVARLLPGDLAGVEELHAHAQFRVFVVKIGRQ